MKEVIYLSNQELVKELCSYRGMAWWKNEPKRYHELKAEVLRRLNEPWRKKKDDEPKT